jgi:transketolase
LPNDGIPRLAVEAGVTQGWDQWLGKNDSMIGIDHFGASAPANVLFDKFGFTVDNIIRKAQELIR